MVFHSGLETLREQLGVIIGQASGLVKEKPLIVGATVLGAGVLIPAVGIGVSRIRKKKRKKKTSRKKSTRRKKATHRSPRHRGHKRVSFTTKGGQRVRFLVRGQKRSPKHGRRKSGKKARRFIKGTPEAKRFMAKLRRMKR